MYTVGLRWPLDPERGQEFYGPFGDLKEAEDWVAACIDATDLGWELLRGVSYMVLPLMAPFDPSTLWEQGN